MTRREFDHYITPPWVVHRFMDLRSWPLQKMTICDPCCGDQDFRKAFESWPGYVPNGLPDITWLNIDIRPEAVADVCQDYLTAEGLPRVDLVIMNPPYSRAMEFVQKARTHSKNTVALLRLNWLASAKRAEWLRANPPSVCVMPNRPSFNGQGTDATDYAWFQWPARNSNGDLGFCAETPMDVRREQGVTIRLRIKALDQLRIENDRQLQLPHMETTHAIP